MRTSLEIQTEVIERFGFFPPFFAPAVSSPQVLEGLWQQTLSSYVNNPIPALFKEKLAALIARGCSVPYCLVCHICSLRPLGKSAAEIFEFLVRWDVPVENVNDKSTKILNSYEGPTDKWPEENSELEEAILQLSLAICLGDDQALLYFAQIKKVIGEEYFCYLSLFIAYNKTCLSWAECHAEALSFEKDRRAQENLLPLLSQEPSLEEFFANYREKYSHTAQYLRTKDEIWASEARYRELNKELESRILDRTSELEVELANR